LKTENGLFHIAIIGLISIKLYTYKVEYTKLIYIRLKRKSKLTDTKDSDSY